MLDFRLLLQIYLSNPFSDKECLFSSVCYMKPKIMKINSASTQPKPSRTAVGSRANAQKIDQLQKKLKEIEDVKIPAIIARRAEAASWGDLSENAGYEQANADLALYQSVAQSLKMEIKHLEEGL